MEIRSEHVSRYNEKSQNQNAIACQGISSTCLKPLLHPINNREHTDTDPYRKNKERSDIEVVTFPRLRFLHVEVDDERETQNQKRRCRDGRHFPVLAPVIERTQKAEKQWNSIQLFPVNTRLLEVPLTPYEIPAKIPQIHVVKLVLQEIIHVAGILLLCRPLIRLGIPSPVDKRCLTVLFSVDVRDQTSHRARVILIHWGLGIRANVHQRIRGIAKNDEEETEQRNVEDTVMPLDRLIDAVDSSPEQDERQVCEDIALHSPEFSVEQRRKCFHDTQIDDSKNNQ